MSETGSQAGDEGLILRGRIEDTSVPELLRSVLGSGETGVLTFRRRDVTKSVYLHMGRVTYARSSDPDERLGETLLQRGKITIRDYVEASKLVSPGRRLGTILIELGVLETEDLREVAVVVTVGGQPAGTPVELLGCFLASILEDLGGDALP